LDGTCAKFVDVLCGIRQGYGHSGWLCAAPAKVGDESVPVPPVMAMGFTGPGERNSQVALHVLLMGL
jgi:hypothetical protein